MDSCDGIEFSEEPPLLEKELACAECIIRELKSRNLKYTAKLLATIDERHGDPVEIVDILEERLASEDRPYEVRLESEGARSVIEIEHIDSAESEHKC